MPKRACAARAAAKWYNEPFPFQWGDTLVSALQDGLQPVMVRPAKVLQGVQARSKHEFREYADLYESKMRTLPDYLRNGMKLIIVGCNPGDRSARVGHYYAGRGNEFWPLLYDSGVVPELLDHRDDKRMIEFGIGLTDLVKRPTRGIEELTREEFAEGRIMLAQKLEAVRAAGDCLQWRRHV